MDKTGKTLLSRMINYETGYVTEQYSTQWGAVFSVITPDGHRIMETAATGKTLDKIGECHRAIEQHMNWGK